MNFSTNDLAELKWSAGALVLSLGLCAGLITLSSSFLEKSRIALQAAQKQLNTAREQLAAAQSDRENMSTYALEYDALLSRKVIGNELRLDWIEGLNKLRLQGIVLDFKYSIAPQQSFAPSPSVNAGNFQLNRSGMSLHIDLKHEEQLLHLLSAIHTQINGWFMLDGCTLTRADAKSNTGTLKAECSGGWFTMKNKSAP